MKNYYLLKYLLFITLFYTLAIGCTKKEIEIPDDMLLVQEGEFTFGSNDFKTVKKKEQYKSNKPLFADEYPEQKVFLPTFFIDKFEVTNKKFARYNTGYKYPAGMNNHPAVKVNWFEASRYCKTVGRRLPTEEEWEKAARGANGNIYPWGNTFDVNFANVGRAKKKKSTPVGLFEKGVSAYGVYDMIGNVGEWTSSWYMPYKGSDYKHEDFDKKQRVIRGSSWGGVGHYMIDAYDRASFRRSADPGAKIPDVGFRCVKEQ